MQSTRIGLAWRARLGRWTRASRLLYTPLSLAFVAYLLLSEHQRIISYLSGVHAALAAKVFFLVALGHLCIAISSHFMFLSLEQQPGFGLVLYTHVNRLPARYLPGGIWQTVSRALDFSAHGLPRDAVLRVMVLEMTVSACLAALIGGLLLGWSDAGSLAPLPWLGATAGAIGLVTAPRIAQLVGPLRHPVDPRDYTFAVASFTLVWLLYGSAFVLFVSEILPEFDWLLVVGVYLISWLAGFLAFFAPQGIGVFELTVSYLLTGDLTGSLVASMFAFRVFTMVSDLGIWSIFRLLGYEPSAGKLHV